MPMPGKKKRERGERGEQHHRKPLLRKRLIDDVGEGADVGDRLGRIVAVEGADDSRSSRSGIGFSANNQAESEGVPGASRWFEELRERRVDHVLWIVIERVTANVGHYSYDLSHDGGRESEREAATDGILVRPVRSPLG